MEDRALDPDDGRHMRLPFRPNDRLRGVEHGDGSCFVAIAPVLVDTTFARQGRGGRADRLGFAAQDRLIVLELDNQMGVGGGSDFKGFLRVHGVASDNASGNIEFGQQSLHGRNFVGLLIDLDVRERQRRIDGEGAEVSGANSRAEGLAR